MSRMNIIFLFLFGLNLQAGERTGQARLTLGSAQVSPTQLNTEMTAQGLKQVDLNNQFGLEITFPLNDMISYGLRYNVRIVSQDEATPNPATDYTVQVEQQNMASVVRFNLLKKDYIRRQGLLWLSVLESIFL